MLVRGRSRKCLELPHWRLSGLREVAEGPPRPGAFHRRHRPLPEDRRRAQRNHPPDGRNRSSNRSPRRLARCLHEVIWTAAAKLPLLVRCQTIAPTRRAKQKRELTSKTKAGAAAPAVQSDRRGLRALLDG